MHESFVVSLLSVFEISVTKNNGEIDSDNGTNTVSVDQGPGVTAHDSETEESNDPIPSNETSIVEESSSNDIEDTDVLNATGPGCIDFKNGGFRMYLCKNAQYSLHEHECSFALCPECFDDKNANNVCSGRASTSAYAVRPNKRPRTTGGRDPKECHHDPVSLMTFDTKSDFTQERMDKIGVKRCVECSRTIPPQ